MLLDCFLRQQYVCKNLRIYTTKSVIYRSYDIADINLEGFFKRFKINLIISDPKLIYYVNNPPVSVYL